MPVRLRRDGSHLVLELDNAGWHTAPNLAVAEGLRLVSLPPYSPELQPAEHLWPILDEPLANRPFETLADLERTVADRCRVLVGDQLSPGTNFHCGPSQPPRANQPEFVSHPCFLGWRGPSSGMAQREVFLCAGSSCYGYHGSRHAARRSRSDQTEAPMTYCVGILSRKAS